MLLVMAGTLMALFGVAGIILGFLGGAPALIGLSSPVAAFGLMVAYVGRARSHRPDAGPGPRDPAA